MNKRGRIVRWLCAAVALAAAVSAIGQETADDVEFWPDRMNMALEQTNYRGTFVHAVDGKQETLHIVHRYADGSVRERISSTGGEGSEILRTPDAVRSVFPEKQLVVVEESKVSSMPLASSFNYTDELERYYQMTTFQKGKIADRETQVVSIRARDEYRYGYLLWLDRVSALPVKMEVRNEALDIIESIAFTELEILDSIPEFAVAPSIDTEGFTWKRPIKAKPESSTGEIWGATRLPTGFRLSVSQTSLLAGSQYPVQHLVYTDGLATVSVFIAHPLSDADMPEGFQRFGSTHFYSLKVDGRLVTAMGDVPRLTVQRIATSLDAR
jgi:sigma-E factor negative regulatory protein RseB